MIRIIKKGHRKETAVIRGLVKGFTEEKWEKERGKTK